MTTEDATHDATTGATPGDGRPIHLVVLYGGRSAEHDISCTTAAHVLRAADPAKYRITPIGISRTGTWAIDVSAQAALAEGVESLPGALVPVGTEIAPSPFLAEASASGCTVVMPLLHGPMGEDGTVQGLLELMDLPYVGSGVLGSAVCMDKAMAKQVLRAAGIPQAEHLAFRERDLASAPREATCREIADRLGLPLFVKPANMGSSIGVSKVKTIEALREAIDAALAYDEWVVVEEAVEGREIEVAVLGDLEPRASVPGEIVPGAEFYDYSDKYVSHASQALVPAPLSPGESDEVRRMALEVYRALRCDGMARIDFFYETGGRARGFLCNEANTIPGFTPISMYPKLWVATGLSYSALIDELVRLAVDRHARKRHNTSHA